MVAVVTVDSGVAIDVIGGIVSEGATFPVGGVLPWSNKLDEVESRSASRCSSSASVPLADVEGLQEVLKYCVQDGDKKTVRFVVVAFGVHVCRRKNFLLL